MNGDYGAHWVLISGHRPLVWVRQSPLAMGGGGNVQIAFGRNRRVATRQSRSSAVRGPANPDTVGACVAPSALSAEPNLV